MAPVTNIRLTRRGDGHPCSTEVNVHDALSKFVENPTVRTPSRDTERQTIWKPPYYRPLFWQCQSAGRQHSCRPADTAELCLHLARETAPPVRRPSSSLASLRRLIHSLSFARKRCDVPGRGRVGKATRKLSAG